MADRWHWQTERDSARIVHFPEIQTVLKRIEAIEVFDPGLHISAITAPGLTMDTHDDALVLITCSTEPADQLAFGRTPLLDRGGHV